MDCHSRKFLNRLQESLAPYDYVLLDFLPAAVRKRHAHYRLEMLVSKSHYSAVLAVLSDAASLNFLRTRMHHHAQEIEMVFHDLSHLTVMLRTELHYGRFSYADPATVFSRSRIENGFKVPSLADAFEYHLLKSLSEKNDFPQAYSDYFSNCSFEERSSIFASLVPKYKFVINVLDDLMHYKSKNYRLVKQALRKMKLNKGLQRFRCWFYPVNGLMKNLLFGRWIYYYSADKQEAGCSALSDFLIRKTYLRAG